MSIRGTLIQSNPVKEGDTVGIFYDANTKLLFFTLNKMVNGNIATISSGLYYIYIIISPHNETKIMSNFGPRFLFPIKEYCDSNMFGNVNSDVRYGHQKSDTLNIQKKSEKFWKVKVKKMVENYFFGCLSDEEKQLDYHLLFCGKNSVDFELLISRLTHMTKNNFFSKNSSIRK